MVTDSSLGSPLTHGEMDRAQRLEQRALRDQPETRVFGRTGPRVAFRFPLSILITLSGATVLDVLCHISVTASHIFEAEDRKHVCYGQKCFS